MKQEERILRELGHTKINVYDDVYATPYTNDVSVYAYTKGNVILVGARNRITRQNTIIKEVARND